MILQYYTIQKYNKRQNINIFAKNDSAWRSLGILCMVHDGNPKFLRLFITAVTTTITYMSDRRVRTERAGRYRRHDYKEQRTTFYKCSLL